MDSFLYNIVILFGATLIVILVSRKLRIPPVVGFLLTGMAVGPHGLALIPQSESVQKLAELGVVFLLFNIGLDLSLQRLKKLGRFFAMGGGLQTGITILLTALISLTAGFALRQSLFFGFLLSMSSTAIVLKIYSDRQELDTPQGQLSLGMLLFQDILIVPLLLVMPLLAGTGGFTAGVFFRHTFLSVLILAGVFLLSRALIPRFLSYIVQTRVRELLVIGALFLCLGLSFITERLGFSLALGAFLAGILIADSDYFHQVIAETSPFRDLFNSIFFISIGMLLDLHFAGSRFPLVLSISAAILGLKFIGVFGASRLLALPVRIGVFTALGLSQIGEFSFVLILSGFSLRLVDNAYYQALIASSVLTMLITPFLIGMGPALFLRRSAKLNLSPIRPADKARAGHVVIVGFGLAGRHLAGVLKKAGIPYVIVELNGLTVREALGRNEPIFYGDATRSSILEKAGIHRAQIAVWVISDTEAVRRGICLAKQMNPDLFVIVRTRQFSEIRELKRCGADEVVSEEFETSIEIFTSVLSRLHIPGNIIRSQTRLLRHDGYEMMRSTSPSGMNEKVAMIMAMGVTDTFLLLPEHAACGKTLVELALRTQTGATIIAVVRGEAHVTNPPLEYRLKAGDLLILVGTHAQMDKAFRFLDGKPEGQGA